MGVRPEDIFLSQEPEPKYIETKVHIVEPLGSENIIDLNIGKNLEKDEDILLRARTSPAFTVNAGQKIWMNFDMARMHIFDPKTEKAIL